MDTKKAQHGWLISGGETLAREKDFTSGWRDAEAAARGNGWLSLIHCSEAYADGANAYRRKQAELARREGAKE